MQVTDNGTNAAAGLIVGVQYAQELARLESEIKQFDSGRPYRVGANGTIELLERLQNAPTWRRGTAAFYEALTFSRFVKRFRNASSVIFADAFAETPKFTALLDYHPAGADQNVARWDLFRAVLPLRFTESWKAWMGANGKALAQDVFAQFLEDNIPDIAEPNGATLVEIARTLEATIGVDWKSHIRADNGQHRFAYIETVDGRAKDGSVTIPQELTLILQPFEGSKRYEVKARFRYKIITGKVSMWFDLVRPRDVLTEAFNDELLKIDGEINGAPSGDERPASAPPIVPIYNGPAPEPVTPAADK